MENMEKSKDQAEANQKNAFQVFMDSLKAEKGDKDYIGNNNRSLFKAVLLTSLFGPLGLMYTNVAVGAIMIAVVAIGIITIPFVIGLFILPLSWIFMIYYSAKETTPPNEAGLVSSDPAIAGLLSFLLGPIGSLYAGGGKTFFLHLVFSITAALLCLIPIIGWIAAFIIWNLWPAIAAKTKAKKVLGRENAMLQYAKNNAG